MAIQPPSDIVMDVLKAADPAALEMAQAKLRSGQAANEAQRLASTSESFDATLGRHLKTARALDKVDAQKIPESYKNFEGMILQNMVKTMLPDSSEIYGKGASGEIWKGMLAEQLGNAIAKDGGIGIAASLASKGTTKIETDREAYLERKDQSAHVALQMLERNQMKALDAFLPGDHSDKDKT